ncbi:CWF complex protein sap62 [Elasticomyces elasticus]|uniref:CWF complex protein sap62 n=1 Tax=Elasticomyces elasticus TaxID=574655 RepID=A0AAN7W3V6_9PEZI|nr:CWF complex protein sap62 [Elasticomyces elasticus]
MDYQNRAGSKFGGGGVASQSATNADRRERLRKLALETIDLDKDPYFFKNHVGSFECRLCLTVHQNDGSYLAHTQGRKHQTNLARRAAKDAQLGRRNQTEEGYTGANSVPIKRNVVKIGRPGYKITKTRDPVTRHQGLLFQLQYPEITPGVIPRVRFMSAYEQKIEDPPDKAYQYLLIAAEPYETCAFKLQAREVDRREDRYWTWFDGDSKEFWVQITFKTEREERVGWEWRKAVNYAAFLRLGRRFQAKPGTDAAGPAVVRRTSIPHIRHAMRLLARTGLLQMGWYGFGWYGPGWYGLASVFRHEPPSSAKPTKIRRRKCAF